MPLVEDMDVLRNASGEEYGRRKAEHLPKRIAHVCSIGKTSGVCGFGQSGTVYSEMDHLSHP